MYQSIITSGNTGKNSATLKKKNLCEQRSIKILSFSFQASPRRGKQRLKREE